MVKATKQTKKFVSSGKLKQTIEKRRKYQQVQKKVAGRELRKAAKEKHGKGKHADEDSDEEDEEDEDLIVESDEDAGTKKNKGKGYVCLAAKRGKGVYANGTCDTIARPSMKMTLKT
jgi:nucleolar complex protein 2